MKIWKLGDKNKQAQVVTSTPAPAVVTESKPIETVKAATSETFKEHYPLLLPYSYAAIVEDEKNEIKYSVLEPTLTDIDETWIKELKDILWDELFISTKQFKSKEDAENFLKEKIEDTARKYKIKIDENTLGKYQYFIARDFLHFGKIDGIMRDENIEDVSCDGIGSPVFVWHRKYESIPSNISFHTPEELENFIFRIAYL